MTTTTQHNFILRMQDLIMEDWFPNFVKDAQHDVSPQETAFIIFGLKSYLEEDKALRSSLYDAYNHQPGLHLDLLQMVIVEMVSGLRKPEVQELIKKVDKLN